MYVDIREKTNLGAECWKYEIAPKKTNMVNGYVYEHKLVGVATL